MCHRAWSAEKPSEPFIAANQPARIPTQFRRLSERRKADDRDTHRSDEKRVPPREEYRADDWQCKHQQKHRILQRAHVLPDEADEDHAEHIQQRQDAIAPSSWRLTRG